MTAKCLQDAVQTCEERDSWTASQMWQNFVKHTTINTQTHTTDVAAGVITQKAPAVHMSRKKRTSSSRLMALVKLPGMEDKWG